MAYKDLRDFLKELEKHGEVMRISAEVDPVLEITEVTDRVVKAGGPALWFERPTGSKIPLVVNLVGSERRMCLALETDSLDDVAARVSSFLDMKSPQGILEKVKMLPKLAEVGSFFPKTVRSGACQDVVRTENFSLGHLPILKCWPQDGGRYITWPMVMTKNPETGKPQRGLLPHAGLRRTHHGDALADAEARRGTFPQRAREKPRRQTRSGGGDRR